MTTPTPSSLTEAFTHLARTCVTPPPCRESNPGLGDYLTAMATHLAGHVHPGDPRLEAFVGVTDPTGHPWLAVETGSAEEEVLPRAAAERWPFERAFTALAEAIKGTEILGVEGLALPTPDEGQVAYTIAQIRRAATARDWRITVDQAGRQWLTDNAARPPQLIAEVLCDNSEPLQKLINEDVPALIAEIDRLNSILANRSSGSPLTIAKEN